MAFFNKKDAESKKWAITVGATYDTTPGREVLKDMIVSSGMFSTIPLGDDEIIHRHNIMVRLLYEMGILNDENIDKLLDGLLKLRYKE